MKFLKFYIEEINATFLYRWIITDSLTIIMIIDVLLRNVIILYYLSQRFIVNDIFYWVGLRVIKDLK